MHDEAFAEFLIESEENLDLFDRKMVELEVNPTNQAIINEIFRAVHTLKGTAGFFGLPVFQSVSHAGENILGALREEKLFLSPKITSSLLEMGDALRAMLASIRDNGSEGEVSYERLIQELKLHLTKGALSVSRPSSKLVPVQAVIAAPIAPEPAQEAIGNKSTSNHQSQSNATKVFNPNSMMFSATYEKHDNESIRVDVNLLGKLMDLVGELVLTRNQVLQHTALQQDGSLLRVVQRLNLITSELQEGLTKTRMQSIGNLWRKLPRVVRDLSVSCGKQVEVLMEGQETELDKTVLEAIKDPLTHLVRNALDHGIELPADRLAKGKSREGRLQLRAFHESGRVNIEISDDGGGISVEKIKKKAIEKQLISAEQAAKMSEREVLDLIFLPGFSTAEKVTNISGRGVGMDVVKTNIEKIGGSIELQSTLGAGTKFQIRIPLTLAIIPALLVSTGNQQYAIPQTHIIELVRLNTDEQQKIEYLHETPVYRLREQLLPLVFLRGVLGLPAAAELTTLNIAVLYSEQGPFGLVVDHINDTSEIVVKPLAKQLKGLSLYAGTTLMGDGRVSLILDVARLSVPRQHTGKRQEKRLAATNNMRALLIFRVGGTRFAAPLHEISRIERFPQHMIEHSFGREVIQYRGEMLRLIRLSYALGLPPEEDKHDLPILVVRSEEQAIGLVVDEILDSIVGEFTIKKSYPRFGLQGAAVIQEKITDLIDIQAVLQREREEVSHV
jgi:two-component system chemotaxis sensor kinase CheA